jgi:hypothetical protein
MTKKCQSVRQVCRLVDKSIGLLENQSPTCLLNCLAACRRRRRFRFDWFHHVKLERKRFASPATPDNSDIPSTDPEQNRENLRTTIRNNKIKKENAAGDGDSSRDNKFCFVSYEVNLTAGSGLGVEPNRAPFGAEVI